MAEVRTFTSQSAQHIRASVTDENIAMVQERLYKMIDYAKGRYDWYEEQREKRVALALGMLALSGVAMSVVIGSTRPGGIDPNSFVFKSAVSVLTAVFFTAFMVFITYLRGQNLTYTHRKNLNSIYSWYHYGVPEDTNVCIVEYSLFGKFSSLIVQSNDVETLEVKRWRLSQGFADFCKEVTKIWSDKHSRVDEDLQQIFVLQLLQSISRDNLRMMTSTLKIGVILVALSVSGLVLSIIFSGVPLVPAVG